MFNENMLNEYSLEETRIGTFLGKPLYRRVYELELVSDNNGCYADIPINSIEVVKIYGIIPSKYNNSWLIPSNFIETGYNIYVSFDSNHIGISTGNFYNGGTDFKCVVEYTKTTD